MPDFLGFSLVDAAFLYNGLALQSFLRQLLPWWVGFLVHLALLRTFARAITDKRELVQGACYYVLALFMMLVFWPEAVLPFRSISTTVTASQVASYVASQDPDATVVTAEDTHMVPDLLQDPALVTPGLSRILKAQQAIIMHIATRIHRKIDRPFATLLPMQWLWGVDLTGQTTTAIQDWVHSCYLPVATWMMQHGLGETGNDFVPFDGSLMADELARRAVVPGANTGITWMRAPSSGETVFCDRYYQAVEFTTQGWLADLQAPSGRPLAQVLEDELHLSPQWQARLILYREMLKAVGPHVPAPSLLGQYLGLRTVSGATGAVSGGGGTGLWGMLRSATSWGAVAIGAAAGVAQGVGKELQQMIDRLSTLVGVALFLTWWVPYILGIGQMMLIAFLPLVLLLALAKRQFELLLWFFVGLFFLQSAPIWWALVDVAAQLARANITPSGESNNLFTLMAQWGHGMFYSMMVTTLGILAVPFFFAAMVFGRFAVLAQSWRAGA
jgi:hypothetical protein